MLLIFDLIELFLILIWRKLFVLILFL